MPDTDFQKIELNLIPKKGDEPVVFYASQYETTRPFIADLFWGDTEYAPGDDCWAEIDIRKNDDNIVVITDDVTIDNNEVSVILPVQAVTCIGKNLGQVKIYAADDQLIAALNFILEVQADPLAGGVTSETAIDNLIQQIEDITQEVIGDDYYNKTEVDTLLADKADVSDLPDMSLYYTKTATDSLLNAKADKSDTYTKAQVDSALSAKANTADLATVATSGDYDDLINKPAIPAAQIQSDYAQADNTKVDYIKNKPDINAMIAAALLAVMPVEIQTGNPCTFDTDIAVPLKSLLAEIVASGGNGTPLTPIPIVGHSELNLVRCGKNLVSNKIENVNIESTGTIRTIPNFNCFYCSVVAGVTYTITTSDVNLVYAFFDTLPDIDVSSYDGTRTVTVLTNNTVIAPITGYLVFRSNDVSFTQAQVEVGNQATTYAPYNGQTFTVSFGQTVYGGVYDANAGNVKPNVYYPSYNGETINGRWLSSKDVYVEGNTPTTGAQVVCLDEYDTEIDVSELSVAAIVGTNNITSDCNGDVTASYKVSIQKYVDDQ